MLKLFYNEKEILQGGLADFLGILHNFIGAELRTNDKKNYFLILND